MNHIPQQVKIRQIDSGTDLKSESKVIETSKSDQLKRWTVVVLSCLVFGAAIGGSIASGSLFLKEILASAILVNIPLYMRAIS